MKTTKIALTFCAAALFTLSASAFAQQGSVALRAIAEQEIEVVNDRGETEVRRVEAGKITPGDEVIYTIAYENLGDDAAENITITNPVPVHMTCTDLHEAGSMRITVSVDGGSTFDLAENLVVVEGDGTERPAKLADWTHIRWTLTDPLAPGAVGEVAFRAVLQ